VGRFSQQLAIMREVLLVDELFHYHPPGARPFECSYAALRPRAGGALEA
jgi:hypothetical protein